ncbi:unnamed protein product, partial [Pylaiella littoralis]
MGYWQDGLKETMPKIDFKNHGWGVDPKAKGREAEELIGSNCVLWLSEHSYIGTDSKTKTLTCGCHPDLPPHRMCRSCGCRGRKCSLACGCRG